MQDEAEARRAHEEFVVAHRLFRRYEHKDTAWPIEFLLRTAGGGPAPTGHGRSVAGREPRRRQWKTAGHRSQEELHDPGSR